MQSRLNKIDGWSVLAGAALGLLLGLAGAHLDRRGEVYGELDRYGDSLLHEGAQIRAEVQHAAWSVEHDGLALCSDAELEFMRRWVFGSPVVRDLGRNGPSGLVCTTATGRLPAPIPSERPDARIGGVSLYMSHRLVLSPRARGLIYATPTVSVVLNTEQFQSLNEPPYTYSGWVYSPGQHLLLHSFGHPMTELRPEEVLRGRWLRRNGMLYRSKCAIEIGQCYVAAAPVALLTPSRANLFTFGAAGAVLGAAIMCTVLLWLAARRSLEHQLRHALRRGRLHMEYQPVVDLASRRIVAVEALARWTQPDGSTISPQVFVPAAEQSGQIAALTRCAVEHVLRDLGAVLRASSLRVMVNISAHDLADPGFGGFLARTLAAAEVPAARLGLELTEHSTADQSVAIDAVKRLRQEGHAVYIDDFGTGYSSLAYLHQLSVDAIKIDRSFVQTVGTEAVTATVVPQILAMAERLHLQIVVEGIETEEQAVHFARVAPGACGQGWCFGAPMPAALLLDLLQRTGHHLAAAAVHDPEAKLAALPTA